MCLCGLRLKTHYFPHTVHYCCSSMSRLSETRRFFYKAHRSENRSVLWLASYPVRCDWPNTSSWDGNVTPLTVLGCRVPAWRHKHNKTHYKLGICGIHWGNITDYNDLYCLLNITMSAFVIRETTNNKHYSTLLKTHIWIVSSRNIFTGSESEAPDYPCKVGSAPFYRNSLCERQHCRLLVQVQGIVLHKMRCPHSNIWFELFWKSVLNTT